MPKPQKQSPTEYALYKGDEFIDLGTLDEIAQRQNKRKQTLQFIATPAYKKRSAKSTNPLILIRLD